jgi:hypothetical protein
MRLWGEAWVVPGQQAGSGKAAAGFRSPRAFGRLVRRGLVGRGLVTWKR